MASFLARALGLDPIVPDGVILMAEEAGAGSAVALTSDDNPVISYLNGSCDLLVALCKDPDCRDWNTKVLATGGVKFDGEIALDAEDRPYVPYVSGGELFLARCLDPSCNSVERQDITGSDADANRSRPSIAFGPDELPIIAFVDAPWVVTAKCANVSCSASALTAVEDVDLATADPTVRIGSDGLPVISYYHAGEFALRVAHCFDSPCTSGSVRTLDGGETCCVGQADSMLIGSDGFRFIAHYDWSDDNLVVSHCLDLACAATFDRTVDSNGSVGSHTAVALRPDGLPTVIYRDSTNDDLKMYECQTLNCNLAGNAGVTVAAEGDVGTYPSLVINSDGTHIMTYRDEGQDALLLHYLP